MTLSKETADTIRDARRNSPELDKALDEVETIIVGALGAISRAAHTERPLNDTIEHKDINAALDTCLLAEVALDAVYVGISA